MKESAQAKEKHDDNRWGLELTQRAKRIPARRKAHGRFRERLKRNLFVLYDLGQ
jgi:hypothetical protein